MRMHNNNAQDHAICGVVAVVFACVVMALALAVVPARTAWAVGVPDGVPDTVLRELASQGIYPGTVDDNGVWTAIDAASESDATIKATVTLPSGTTAAENSCLFIRKVIPGEGYYPADDAIEEKAGRTNDAQCYAIHWVQFYQDDNGDWTYKLETDSVLGDNVPNATVKIEYLKDTAYLKGHQANRKLQVYNSRDYNGTVLEENATPTEVTANTEAYTGFTFETNRGGPYVFVSKYLYEGYVSSITASTVDGSAPFDANDEAGNDSGDTNGIVRSYDTVQYNLIVNYGARSNVSTDADAEIGFEMILPADINEAAFNTAGMLWMGSNYSIEYLDAAGKVVLTQGPDGTYVDSDGNKVSVNNLVCGSDQGLSSYTSSIVSQKLTGSISVHSDENLLAANNTLKAAVQVLGATNKTEIKPTFKAWFVGNEDNYGSESGHGDEVHLAEIVTDNNVTPEPVKVSAAARFNLELAKNTNVSYRTWFDSSMGNEVNAVASYTIAGTTVTGAQMYQLLEALGNLEENYNKSNPQDFTDAGNVCAKHLNGKSLEDYKDVFAAIRYGRMTGYGIGLQIYNDVSNAQGKGFRGVSLPQGEISFDLDLQTRIDNVTGTIAKDQYYAQLWEYNENVAERQGNSGKQLYWDYLQSTCYAAWAAPYNSGGNSETGCYNGGTWAMQNNHFTISGYDLNFLAMGLQFPTHKAGNSSATDGYNSYIGNFSAGYVEVLNVMPRVQNGTLTLSTQVAVKNLEVATTDGTKITPDPITDPDGYAHETNGKDNAISDSIPLYSPGGMTKANAFDRAELYDEEGNFSSGNYFLGTDFWGTSYDCSAFAGQDITLVGAARIGAGDYKIRHANMLQLFDSEALSLNLEKGAAKVITRIDGAVTGKTNILYAADPDYPQGYDTNNSSVLLYMSTVREEDLVYYESLDELQRAGYTCIGVMAELRNWFIPGEGGYSTSLLIPMTVSEDEKFVGKTVATVNSVRIWTNENDMQNGAVTWANGTYDFSTGKNAVAGYTPMEGNNEEHYRGEVANDGDAGRYVKTEYANGQVVLGTNAGGYVYGSSLLILNYKSTVNIGVDNGGNGTLPTFNLDQGDYTVNYHVSNIQARTEDPAGSAQDTHTDLTVLAKLDTGLAADADQRIEVAADSYKVVPASAQMVLVDERGSKLSEQSVPISSDPQNPTTVRYAFVDQSTGDIDVNHIYEIQVYAQRDTNGKEVTFKILNATVDVAVPDITFEALIDPSATKDSDRIVTGAYISGTSDVRAYSDTNGNMDAKTIGIIQLQATRLVKSVDKEYIELGGAIKYSVTYTNGGNQPVNFYMYDLLPDNDDIRGSDYKGEAILRDVAARLSGEGSFTAEIVFYYSKTPYDQLYNMVRVFGNQDGTGRNPANIENMLSNALWFQPLGTISSASNHEFVPAKHLQDMSVEGRTEEMRRMTGIYAVVKNLGGGRSLTIDLTVEGEGNAAGNLYRNIANSWLGDASEPLTSNMVSTSVLSRAINGVVWEDANLNGVRDDGEKLINGVTCTLFKWDDAARKYVRCTQDITGTAINPVTTGEDGAYSFDKLAAGKYIVAFSGDALDNYKGATTYRVNGENDTSTNDAVALIATPGSNIDTEAQAINGIGNGYSYAIAYDLTRDSADATKATVGPTMLHAIDDIVGGNITLTNSVELYANLDCGLVKSSGPELPDTGAGGTNTIYAVGGALAAAAAICLLYTRGRRAA